MVRECRPPAREPARSWLARRSTIATSTPANANSPASISPVGPPPAITTACSCHFAAPISVGRGLRPAIMRHDPGLVSSPTCAINWRWRGRLGPREAPARSRAGLFVERRPAWPAWRAGHRQLLDRRAMRLGGGGRGLQGREPLGRQLAGVLLLDALEPRRRPRPPCARPPRRGRRSSDLSISANSSSTSRSCGTFRSGLPWAKIRPSFLAPVMPKSACEASPMPFTAQPSTATSIGSS